MVQCSGGGMKMSKLLFFDIDGTLLSEITREIPQSALEALKRTEEKGNLTFLIPDAPGRTFRKS